MDIETLACCIEQAALDALDEAGYMPAGRTQYLIFSDDGGVEIITGPEKATRRVKKQRVFAVVNMSGVFPIGSARQYLAKDGRVKERWFRSVGDIQPQRLQYVAMDQVRDADAAREVASRYEWDARAAYALTIKQARLLIQSRSAVEVRHARDFERRRNVFPIFFFKNLDSIDLI